MMTVRYPNTATAIVFLDGLYEMKTAIALLPYLYVWVLSRRRSHSACLPHFDLISYLIYLLPYYVQDTDHIPEVILTDVVRMDLKE